MNAPSPTAPVATTATTTPVATTATAAATTPWERGRFDSRRGPRRILFGRMYEDASIERRAFQGKGRIFCIASAGCTALALAPEHEVVAVDINPIQLAYAERRCAGAPLERGTAERVMDLGRGVAPLLGWTRPRLEQFLALHSTEAQLTLWRSRLDTRRFRAAFDGLLSISALRFVYGRHFLDFLPRRLGQVFRGRMERCFARHPNAQNPYARALFLGELTAEPLPARASAIRLIHSDAAAYLEQAPAGSFEGFTLSNILDGADAAFRDRLFAAVRRAAAPGAVAVLRSFAEPPADLSTNQAADDRSMLWGEVLVRPAASLGQPRLAAVPLARTAVM
jgi:S-adenosylmethionine:diacylglycerol 3-amino-3-carboxypropyl transferase